jgi:tetratricopeptide (TPR) repeat protein
MLEKSRESDLQLAGGLFALGSYYLEQRNYSAAEPPLRKSLTIQETDPNEPKLPYRVVNLAITTYRLARLQAEQERYAEAQPLFRKALETYEAVGLGEHPSVAACLQQYAAILRKTGRGAEAEPLESRA